MGNIKCFWILTTHLLLKFLNITHQSNREDALSIKVLLLTFCILQHSSSAPVVLTNVSVLLFIGITQTCLKSISRKGKRHFHIFDGDKFEQRKIGKEGN